MTSFPVHPEGTAGLQSLTTIHIDHLDAGGLEEVIQFSGSFRSGHCFDHDR